MQSFIFQNPTKILFGDGMVDRLPEELKAFGPKVLLTCGCGSIRRSGLYDRVMKLLHEADKEVFEVSGIMPNPRTEKVYEGIEICRREKIDLILAVGGGSVIDGSKAMAAGTYHDGDFWQDLYVDGQSIDRAVPLGVILTMPATGSEMNGSSVVSHWANNQKIGYWSQLLHPHFSILEPSLTMTMPREQVVYGAVDMMSHIMEQYFSPPEDNNISDAFAEALFCNIRQNLDHALEDLNDYDARSNLMWDATMALNGLISLGKEEDWQSHSIEHALSAWYDIPHGAGLAIVHPNLLYYMRKEAHPKLVRFATNVWGINPLGMSEEMRAMAAVTCLKNYLKDIGAPTTLTEVGIPAEAIDDLAATAETAQKAGYKTLTRDDIAEILRLSL